MYLSSQYSESQSQASESTALLSESKQNSKLKLNEQPTYGVYNRNDYMARCYRNCWRHNSRIGPTLRKLLCFGGQSSLSGDCCSSFFFVLIMLLPFASLITLFPIKDLTYVVKIILASVVLSVCLLLCLWHMYSILIINRNKKVWLNSWFTFEIDKTAFTSVGEVTNRFFDIRRHLRFYDITRDSLNNFPLLDFKQKKKLSEQFNFENMNRARVILFTSRFLDSVHGFPLKIAMFMLLVSMLAAGMSTYELVVLAKHR